MAGIDVPDWEPTPVSVRNLVVQLVGKIEQLEQRLQELKIENEQLREKLDHNSRNSHNSPASDPPNVEKVKKKKSRGKKRGGQPGHEGSSRPLYPVEECSRVIDFEGILNSDRYSAYNWLDVTQRQLCWAHLKRDFTKISQRSGVSRQIRRNLLAQNKKLFRL